MYIRVNFKKPGRGMYRMLLTWGEKLQFSKGRARRVPVDEETVFNTVPIKYITSIELPAQPKEVAMGDTISVNREQFQEFKRLYEATEPGKTFMFLGKEVLKEFAKYIIEYYGPEFDKQDAEVLKGVDGQLYWRFSEIEE